MQHRAVPAALAAAALLLTAGCSSDGGGGGPSAGADSAAPSRTASGSSPSQGAAERTPPAKGSVKVVRTVTEGLKSPWGLAPLPDGDLLVSSRDEGTITRIDGQSGKKTELGEVPGVSPAGEGGLLGIAISPDYASDHMITPISGLGLGQPRRPHAVRREEAVRRATGCARHDLSRASPKGVIHNGGRIAFGPDRMLYAGTGESGDTGLSQDTKSLGGKILRLTPEGDPRQVPGNPFPDSPVYSYGHRNVQGLAWDSKQRLFASEFGQDTWDELNAIKPGGNYGWPDAEGRSDSSGPPCRPAGAGPAYVFRARSPRRPATAASAIRSR
ncbi:PQQ-dependent sugar dehydrogenase OS=Streptomyces alboniger OX=132473 GN=CP975_25285 PE=4 SV=1 [Streptomyces alboniger]